MFEYISSVGDKLLNSKCYYYAAIWFSRLSEIDAKMKRKQIHEKLINAERLLLSKRKDSKIIWSKSKVCESLEKIKTISLEATHSLKKCSGIFALTHQSDRNDYPDLLGYCYNRICETLISSIANDDISTFKSMYSGFLGTVLLYQEYIRTDTIKKKEDYTQSVNLNVLSTPILEFAKISGLAILWGEFIGSEEWRATVGEELVPYTDKLNVEKYNILLWIIQNITAHKSLLGIGNRAVLEIEWEQRISSAILSHPNYKIAYADYGEKYIISNSKLFTAFTRHSLAFSGVLRDTEELFCVLCVNPHVEDDQKYHSKSAWERIINEDEEV